jgi:hypothetical protein
MSVGRQRKAERSVQISIIRVNHLSHTCIV